VENRLAAATALLGRHPLIDGHNDLPWELRLHRGSDLERADLAAGLDFTHTDLPRLARGKVGAQFWSVYVPASLAGEAAVAATLEQIDLVRRMVRRYPGRLDLALTAADVDWIFSAGKIASLIGAEGGHSIACSMGVLRMLYESGVRYLTLTHNANVPWADSATDEPAAGGLTAFGREVVREMQRLGMLADLSHVAPATMRDALDTAEAPVIFSHSSALALCDHPRNVPDEILARLPANRGVCMVTFVPAFVSQDCREWEQELLAEMQRRGLDMWDHASRARARRERAATHPAPRATLAQVADHVEHVRDIAGVDHVGLGGDFDGTDDLPDGLFDVSCYPALFAELLERGWSEEDCGRLAGGNVLRVLREAEEAAAAIQQRRGPSVARIEDEGAVPPAPAAPAGRASPADPAGVS
jgi:membrane dipeptidase